MPNLITRLLKGSKFRQSWFAYFGRGQKLYLDSSLPGHIQSGYEENYTVFGAANKLASKAVSIPIIPMKGEEKLEGPDPRLKFFESNKADYTLNEFRRHWHIFRYILGESMAYVLRYELGGPDNGKPFALDILPPQNVDLIFGEYSEVIEYYRVNRNEKPENDILPENVHHSRLFPNLDFDDGKQFRSLSPVKVAADIIRAMNAGNKQDADLKETGTPPFMIINEDLDVSDSKVQKKILEEQWVQQSKDKPMFGTGRIKKLDFGFSTLKDLMILETDSRGLMAICNMWGVHVSLFSDQHATENNILTARKLMYEDRAIPDAKDECEFWNWIFKESDITFIPDISQIPAMQEDKEKLAKVYAIAYDKKATTGNEIREHVLGLDPIDIPEMGEEGLIERLMFVPDIPGIDGGFTEDDKDKDKDKDDE